MRARWSSSAPWAIGAAKARRRYCDAGVAAEYFEGGHVAWVAAGLPLVDPTKITARDSVGRSLWITRLRPKIDRIACSWLIRRFVNLRAVFLFVAPAEVTEVTDLFRAMPYDSEGVVWRHRDDRRSFDAMVAEFGRGIPALDRLATISRARTPTGSISRTRRRGLSPPRSACLGCTPTISSSSGRAWRSTTPSIAGRTMDKRWLGGGRFLHALNFCMLLTGQEAQRLATYPGRLMHDSRCGLIAGALFLLSGGIAIIALSWLYRGRHRRGGILRAEGGRCRHRVQRRDPARLPNAAKWSHATDRRRRLRRHLLFWRTVSRHRPRRWPARLPRRAGGARRVPAPRGPRRRRRGACARCRPCSAKSWRAFPRPCGGARSGPVRLPSRSCSTGDHARGVRPAGQRLPRRRALLVPHDRGCIRRRLPPYSPMSRRRRLKAMAGSPSARCSTASTWPRPRLGR